MRITGSTNDGISIDQSRHIRQVLERYGMLDSKPVSTLLAPGAPLVKVTELDDDDVDLKHYQGMVGSIMYAMLCTCPQVGICNPTALTIQFKASECTFSGGGTRSPLPSRDPQRQFEHFETQRRDHQLDPNLLRCRLCSGRRQKIAKTKHINVPLHFIRDHVNKVTIDVEYYPTENMLADVMTKGLAKEQHIVRIDGGWTVQTNHDAVTG